MKAIARPASLRPVIPAGAAFAAAFSCCLFLRSGPVNPAAIAEPSSPLAVPAASLESVEHSALSLMRNSGGGTRPAAEEILELADEAGRLDSKSMNALLTNLISGEEKDRGAEVIRALLIQWTRRDPPAAVSWLLEDFEKRKNICSFNETASAWAVMDSGGMRRWLLREWPVNPVAWEYRGLFLAALGEVNPMEAARLFEAAPPGIQPATGFEMARWAQSVTDVKPWLEEALAHCGFPAGEDAKERAPSDNRRVWRDVLRATAARWNDLDPGAFQKWMETQPASVREAALEATKTFSSRGRGSIEGWTPPAPDTSTEPPPSFANLDPQAVPPPENAAALRSDWAVWWKRNRGAAEAFLTQSAWPEEMKFRARAAALAGAP